MGAYRLNLVSFSILTCTTRIIFPDDDFEHENNNFPQRLGH